MVLEQHTFPKDMDGLKYGVGTKSRLSKHGLSKRRLFQNVE